MCRRVRWACEYLSGHWYVVPLPRLRQGEGDFLVGRVRVGGSRMGAAAHWADRVSRYPLRGTSRPCAAPRTRTWVGWLLRGGYLYPRQPFPHPGVRCLGWCGHGFPVGLGNLRSMLTKGSRAVFFWRCSLSSFQSTRAMSGLVPCPGIALGGRSTQGAKRHSDASWRLVRASPPRRTGLVRRGSFHKRGNLLVDLHPHLAEILDGTVNGVHVAVFLQQFIADVRLVAMRETL